jgi:hypothetical protein
LDLLEGFRLFFEAGALKIRYEPRFLQSSLFSFGVFTVITMAPTIANNKIRATKINQGK